MARSKRKTELYAQCEYRQPCEAGERVGVAFIPIKAAKVGKVITIDGEEGTWTVISVGTVKDREWLDGQRDMLKRFRAVLKNA